MHIVCPSCSKRLQIADDKLPAGRQVRLTCPACQEDFTVSGRAGKAAADAPSGAVLETSLPAPATPLVPQTPSATSVTNLGITEAGPTPRALICLDVTAHRKAYQDTLRCLGYNTVHAVSNQAQALAYLSQVAYKCVLLDAAFDGSTLEANPILACLSELPMDRRRYMFVALCLASTVPADPMTAYCHSANLVIHQHDAAACRRTLEHHLAEHKHLYRIYRELRQQLGKDM